MMQGMVTPTFERTPTGKRRPKCGRCGHRVVVKEDFPFELDAMPEEDCRIYSWKTFPEGADMVLCYECWDSRDGRWEEQHCFIAQRYENWVGEKSALEEHLLREWLDGVSNTRARTAPAQQMCAGRKE